MEAIVQSFLLVFASEMGDKTQLLALILASRFRKPWPIMAGILCATLLNHGLASAAGGWMGEHIPVQWHAPILALVFFAFAIWILIPDKDEGLDVQPKRGAFLTTVVTFFLAEMGDKTQLATVALGAKFNAPMAVTLGTTAGMLAADGLAVFLGHRFTTRIPMKMVRIFAAALFALFGGYILWAGNLVIDH
jgi:putative Ca2+/H+ antiporter (TMEM165/GDT1 family)